MVDTKGNRRAVFGGGPNDSVGLAMSDLKGVRLILECNQEKDSASLAMYGADQTNRVLLTSVNDQSKLALGDKNGTPRMMLVGDSQLPGLTVTDSTGRDVAGVRCLADLGPVVSLSDNNGKSRLRLQVEKTGPSVAIYDEKGTKRANLGVMERTLPDGKKLTLPESSLLLNDADGKPVGTLP